MKYTIEGYAKEKGIILDPVWSQYSAEDIMRMKNNGVNISKEIVNIASTILETTATNYESNGEEAEEAEDCFKKVIPLDHKQYKTNALYSLGVLCYNDGANILKKAAPLANSDADKYAAEKEKADGRFKEALDYLEEAAKISPENEYVKKMLPQVKAVMK